MVHDFILVNIIDVKCIVRLLYTFVLQSTSLKWSVNMVFCQAIHAGKRGFFGVLFILDSCLQVFFTVCLYVLIMYLV